jgi:hypothetical protein
MKLAYETLESRLMLSHHHHHPHPPIPQPPPVVPPPIVSPPVVPPVTIGAKPMGYQTFYQAGADANAGLHSTQAYYRYDWNTVESAPGVFQFGAMDADYNAAVKAGQKFNFRIMPFEDGNTGPIGLVSLGGNWVTFQGVKTWQPDLNLSAVQADLDLLLKSLGSRYATQTATVDIGWWGPYGEWSNYGMPAPPPLPTISTMKWLIGETQRYFPNSIAVTQAVVDYEWGTTGYLNAAMAAGCWQRMDSWGKADSWDMQADKAVLNAMQQSPYWTKICTIGEPFDTNSWSAADWQSAVAFAKSARMALWSTKGNAIPPSEMSLVEQLIAFEKTL